MVPASNFLRNATALAAFGFSVFPLQVQGKKPLIEKWRRWQTERAGKAQLEEWARKWSDANIAIATGPVSAIIVLDIDTAEGEEIAALHGVPLTPCVRTGRGSHFYFRPLSSPLRNFAGKLPGIDLRAAGGYVVAPGSVHPSGLVYEWGITPEQLPFADPPSWLIDLAKERSLSAPNGSIVTGIKSPKTVPARGNSQISAYAKKAFDDEIAGVRSAIEGERNNTLNDAAFSLGQLIAGGELAEEMVRSALLSAALAAGLEERETLATIESGLSAGDLHPRRAPEREGPRASVDWGEPPRPLRRDIPPTEPYPDGALGEPLGDATRAIHDYVQAPLAICAQSVLAATTLAVQGHANVLLPTESVRPVSIYFVTIAETGERKTSADDRALAAAKQREDELSVTYKEQRGEYQNALDVWEKQRSQILNDKKRDFGTKKAALQELGEAPAPPTPPVLTVPEPTFEGLTRLLLEGASSLGIFSSEGGQFIGGHAMNDDNRLKTAAALSNLWDGNPIKRVRQGDGLSVLRGRRVALHLLVQPLVAERLFGDPVLKDQGILSRLLSVMPNTAAGTRFYRQTQPETFSNISRFSGRLLGILRMPLPKADENSAELRPRLMKLSPKANELWFEFADHIESLIRPGGELEPIRGLANKLPEHAARLGAVIELFSDLHAEELSAETMAHGISLAQFYAAEALRIQAASQINPDLTLAQRLLDWVQKDWPEPTGLISLPDIYQLGPNQIRDKQTASRIVSILENHGYLLRKDGGAKVNGVFRREVWLHRGI